MVARRYIFVSYARRVKPFVDRLMHDLSNAGVPLWRDVDDIKPGSNWPVQISQALRQAAGLIYISSEHSEKSPWIQKELQEVIARSGYVFAIVLDDEGAKNMPPSLREIQWVDFRENYEKQISRLLDAFGVATATGVMVAKPGRTLVGNCLGRSPDRAGKQWSACWRSWRWRG